jgi:phage terminase large subunit
MKATIVFKQIWEAVNAVNPDGSRKYKYIINTGSSRSSKTFSILQSHYLYALGNENKRISIWRETKQDTKNTVLADFKKAIVNFPQSEKIIFNKTESIYTFPNNSTIEICGGDDDNKVHGFQGDVAHFNEPYKISKDTFDQIDMRTTDFVLIDWNPKKGHWIDDLAKLKNAIVIHSTFKDNPFCPTEQKNKILSYQPIAFSKAVMSGILTESEAREYDFEQNVKNLTNNQLRELLRCIENERNNSASAFNWQVYGLGLKAEKPNRIFTWKPIPNHEFDSLKAPEFIGTDWGNVDPWAIVKAKYFDGNLYVHELNYESENLIRERLTLDEINRAGLTSQDETTQQTGLVTYMFDKLKISKKVPIICDTNRPLKIAALRRVGYEDVTGANKPKGSIIDGIDALCGLNVFYTNSSKNIEYEQENYSRKVDRYGIVLEEPEDKDNHTIDAIRYIVLYLIIKGYIKLV